MDLPTAQRAWHDALIVLQQQMTASTFEGRLRGSQVVAVDGAGITVQVRHEHSVYWLSTTGLARAIDNIRYLFPTGTTITFVPPPATPAQPAGTAGTAGPVAEEPAPDSPIPASIRDFNPNTARTGGFAMVGNYANIYWAAYLGTCAWRLYQIVYATDTRKDKADHDWTRPQSFAIAKLARAIPTSRNAIRGRWRSSPCDGEGLGTGVAGRVWRPGAFDILTREGLARIDWHDNDPRWRRWLPGAPQHDRDASGQRFIYRLSVRIVLPLLTSTQVAVLPAALRADHETYLGVQGIDILAWEQIDQPTLAPLDHTAGTGAAAPLNWCPGTS